MATIRRLDDTQAEFAEGTLVGVQATATPSLALAYRPVLSFDGVDDYIAGTNNLGISGDATFTMEVWIKWTSASWSANYPSAMGNNSISVINSGLSMTFRDGRPALDFWNNRFRATSAISAQEYHHVAVVKTPGTISTTSTIYVDGVEVAGAVEGTDTTPNITDSVPIIGRLNSRRNFEGIITEARYWNVARTQQQIQDNMYKELTGTEPGLVAYYKLNEGSGTVATDSAGANDGTIYGATWTTSSSFYMSSGYRVTPPLDCTDLTSISSSSVSWTGILNSQTIIIETRVSTDNGNTWTDWTQVTNGGSIPNIAPGCLVECRQNLSTTDISKTPELTSLDVEINGVTTTLMFACNF